MKITDKFLDGVVKIEFRKAELLSNGNERYMGIYFLVDNKEVVYIGESVNVLNRLYNHVCCTHSPKLADSLYYVPVSNTKDRKMMERVLISIADPKYNSSTHYKNFRVVPTKSLKHLLRANDKLIRRTIKSINANKLLDELEVPYRVTLPVW